MRKVENDARKNPALLEIEVLQDLENSDKYVLLTKWKSRTDLNRWVQDPEYENINNLIDGISSEPVHYQIYEHVSEKMATL